MENIRITEKYALCMLKEKKTLNTWEVLSHLMVSMIIEMMLDENLEIMENKTIKLTGKVPEVDYLKKVYNTILNLKKDNMKVEDIVTYKLLFKDNDRKEIIEMLEKNMISKHLINIENKKIIIINKKCFNINEDKFNSCIEEVRAELLEDGELTDEIILLASLLNSTKFLKNIFNKYEKESISKKLNEINSTDISKKVKIANDVIKIIDFIFLTTSI